MGVRLLIVEEAFVARGPGVLVMPRFADDRSPLTTVELRFSDGRTRTVKATVDVAHMRGVLAPWSMYRLHGVTVEEVPPGTELWSVP